MGQPSSKPRHLVLIAPAAEPTTPRRGSPTQHGDPPVQRAIRLLREDLAARWTVTRLARKVGLSRPVFARRFVQSTGVSPARYLTRERMQRAAQLLRDTPWTLAQVASRVGYDSEFAFNRAFKRHHHVAPGTFRRMANHLTPTLRVAA
ncbi:MAG: AraC family transcriptional regulator [Polyangiales bacterium]